MTFDSRIVRRAAVVFLFNASFVLAQETEQPVSRQGPILTQPARPSASRVSGDVVLADRVRPAAGSFEDKFWRYLVAAKYQNWSPMPKQSAGFVVGGTPHGAYVKTYVNRTASTTPKDLKYKSVLISENYSRDKHTLESLTILYVGKKKRFWVKYLPDGSIARAPASLGGQKLSGSVKNCIECHRGATGDDYVFGN